MPAQPADKEVGEPGVSRTSGASRPAPAGMGLWEALWVLLCLPRALQGQGPHTRAAPSSVLHSFEDSKVRARKGREVPAGPGCGESAKPALWAPLPWKPLASSSREPQTPP